MSNMTPTPSSPPKPSLETVRAIAPSPMRRSSTWACIAACLAAVPAIINPIAPLMPEKYATTCLGVAAGLASLGAVLAHIGSIDAAGRVAEEATGAAAQGDS